ncbi:MAG: hypothetical protein EZS28_031601 [Streblomastix strix]|uniref:Uncharacterized protein n=1 Tax=Streblomastix strix TaxID=222440 RepID=A0A5J4US43_9EUKA|nr:MAG: hypothetical protein EZS28_031600 [Streblomastix strix]KAA6372873.1 MAG: hypothetical protein EZS28_031601 [Streblomastix strix]
MIKKVLIHNQSHLQFFHYQAQNRNTVDNPYETTYYASNQNAGQAGERAQGRGVDAQYDHLAHGNALGDGSDNAYRSADRNRIQKRPQTAADGYQRRYEEQREFKNEIRSSPSNVKKQEYSISKTQTRVTGPQGRTVVTTQYSSSGDLSKPKGYADRYGRYDNQDLQTTQQSSYQSPGYNRHASSEYERNRRHGRSNSFMSYPTYDNPSLSRTWSASARPVDSQLW